MYNISQKDYACPICGKIPPPGLYQSPNPSCYLVKDGKLALPFVKMKPIPCCGGWYPAPYHPNSKEYLEAIRPHLLFFAPTTTWVRSLLSQELEIIRCN